jgi:hypothetical protein
MRYRDELSEDSWLSEGTWSMVSRQESRYEGPRKTRSTEVAGAG